MFSCSTSQSYSLVQCSVLSVSVTASVQYLIPSSSLPPPFIHLFSALPLFHNPDEKTGESALKIFRGGRWVLAETMQKDEEGQRAKRETHRKRENVMWCSPPMPTDKILVLCKRDLRANQNKRVIVEASLKHLSFVACQSSMQAHALVMFRLVQKIHLHIQMHTQLQSRDVLIKAQCFLQWVTLTNHIKWSIEHLALNQAEKHRKK